MARVEKLIQLWLTNPPREEPVERVEAIIKRYFKDKLRKRKPGSHNFVIRDDRLAPFPEFRPYGEFSIPVKSGQKVKGHYLQKLARAVLLIEDLEST